ncbi:ROK family transcriptional regulator [Cellulomonas soli]|uniref:Sugar kinase n=1 Tax=Cellulomonas soli TaxID=931535 RepID=A0A512P8T6_9CELL|nr:ROK family transcriptional regulator [Cellulomonas soli]NYI57834.1 putative NBD/HSP70 family sugar kinase [Cellulomonas soli]GEP67618.1 sugar kinase [Cellulomonas soli]
MPQAQGVPPGSRGDRRAGRSVSVSRRLVLDLVRTRAPISRVELAEATGLTQAAISHAVRALIDEGLLRETGVREYTGGKPRVMLTLDRLARCSVGIQLGADWIVVVVVDARGFVVARTRVRGARSRDPRDVVATLAEQVDVLLTAADVDRSAVVGVGLAVAGALDLDEGAVLVSRTLERWQRFPVRTALAEATGLPVVLDNDATAAAIGEFWSGRIPGSAAHCTIYMGASIGAGIVIAGSVYRGASSNTGPLGRMRLHRDHRSPGATVEDLAAPRAVAARARAAVAAGRSSIAQLSVDGDPFTDFAAVATAAVHGDPLSVALVEESAEYLADAAVAVANILDLDSLVLAGPSFTTAGSLYLTIVERRLEEEFFAAAKHRVRVSLSPQTADAAAVGAASLVLQEELAPRHLGAPGGRSGLSSAAL